MPLLLKDKPQRQAEAGWNKQDKQPRKKQQRSEHGKKSGKNTPLEKGMARFRIEVGYKHDVKPANIVGAIANEAGLDSKHIGHITINEDHSTVDLPDGMPKEVFKDLKKTWVCNQQLRISRQMIETKKQKKKKHGTKAGKPPSRPGTRKKKTYTSADKSRE